jgi:hypothetical protein
MPAFREIDLFIISPGFQSYVWVGTEKVLVKFHISLSYQRLGKYAAKAAGNKSKSAIIGPVLIKIDEDS